MAGPGQQDALTAPGRGAAPPMPDAGETIGDYFEIDSPDEIETEAAPDGGLWVTLNEPYENPRVASDDFFENLALFLPEHVMDTLSTTLLRFVEEDRENRKERDKQYEEGIRRTGMGNDAPGGAQFEGASRVVHPMISEAAIDYESRIIKELWPPSGPVKEKLVGKITEQKADRAKRKVDHMNWQLTVQIEEAFPVTETTLTQVPLGGEQFIKQIWDHNLKRPHWSFIPVDKIILPINASDWNSAKRRGTTETVSAIEFRQRVDSKLYRNIKAAPPSGMPDPTKAETASRKIEGATESSMNLDGDREIVEIMSFEEVTGEMADILGYEEEGELYPYLIAIDVTNKKVLSVYRDWEEQDPTRKPIDHVFGIPFIPWRGALSVGFPQLIGGLSGAATGALRALLDSAFVQTTPGGLIMKGSGTSGQTRRPNPGEFQEVDVGLETDDLRKRVMPYTFNPTPPVLFQLLSFVVDAGKGVVRTSLDETTINSNTNVPVGTQMSRVEEGLVVFSSIHGRVHRAFNRILAGLHRLNSLYLPETLRVDADGKEIFIRRKDYEGPVDIQPVSDPTIYSDQQRFWQYSAIQQRATLVPTLYKLREVEKRWLKVMKIADPDSLLADMPQPHELNAVNENLALALGRPVVAFPEQDHLAHLKTLIDFMESPMFGGNPVIGPVFTPGALKHAAEHIVYYYARVMHDMVSEAAGVEASQLFSVDDKVKAKLDQLLAMASQVAVPRIGQQLQPVLPLLQKALQMMQQIAPKPPMDPAAAAVQASLAETQRTAAADKTGAAQDQAQLTSDTALKQQQNAIAADKNQAMRDDANLEASTKLQTTTLDNETATDIAELRTERGQPAGFSTGKSLEGE